MPLPQWPYQLSMSPLMSSARKGQGSVWPPGNIAQAW